ncbi:MULTISPECIES: PAS domain-containing sensor histidine kinase [unclassified Oleiphilus]|uniref:sensor histidine kinase n=1 Tax=unclassified Oleiphilus TaxID=2631174 RepID=UPI0009EF5605|nr:MULTISPECIES: ATP-binding protein [unclassified Oleiphilus]
MARTSSTKYQETYSAKHSSATGVGLQKAVERVDDELPASKVLKLDAVHPSSYRELEERVVALKSELSLAESNTAQQEKEKQALEHRHSALLEVLPAGVVVLDGKGFISEYNPAAIELLGEPLEGERWLDVITRCFAPKHDDGHEVSLKDGRRLHIKTRSLKSGDGQLILLSDLTETRALQERVSRTERLGSLGKMVASLAHQIRTPLSTAMLYAGHLRRPEMSTEMRIDCAEKLLSRLAHLEHQIRDMLVFAKGETRLAEQVSVRQFFESLHAAATPLVEKYNVKTTWHNESKGQILCNQETLVGACMNLINNSIEAHESQTRDRQLEISIESADAEGRFACIQICDNGPGIPRSLEKKIHEPFFTTKSQGTGLGLAVVQAVIKAHKGQFSLRSGAEGAVATILIPLFKPEQSPLKSTLAREVSS